MNGNHRIAVLQERGYDEIDPPLAGRIGTSPRPRGGDWLEDEVAAWRATGVDHVVSLLTPDEQVELGLESEVELCSAHGIAFTSIPVQDRGLPMSRADFTGAADRLLREVQTGKTVLIHCRQGIGRASLLAAAVLAAAGLDGDSAFRAVERARGRPVPDTEEQRGWLLEALRH